MAEERLGVERPSHHLARNQLRWTGHALRSDDTVLQEVLHFIPEGGARRRGRPNLRFYETIKADLAARDIILPARNQSEFWQLLHNKVANKDEWKEIVNRGR